MKNEIEEVREVTAFEAAKEGLQLPPGSFGWPFFGESLAFVKDMANFTGDRVRKFGKIFKTHVLGERLIVLSEPKYLKFLLLKEGAWTVNEWPESTRRLLGTHSLAVQTGAMHRAQRKLAHNAALSSKGVEKYVDKIAEAAETHIEGWLDEMDMELKMGNAFLSMYERVRSFAFDMACQVLTGLEFRGEELETVQKKFETWKNGLFAMPVNLPCFQFYHALQARKFLVRILEQKVDELRNFVEENPIPPEGHFVSVLEAFVRHEDPLDGKFTREQLVDQAILLLFAGHDTSSSTITAAILFFKTRNGLVDRLFEEQQRVIQQHGERITAESLKEMRILDSCIQEVLRLLPPVAGIFRRATTNIKVGQFLIPKGYKIQYALRSSQHVAAGRGLQADIDWAKDVLDAFQPEENWKDSVSPPFMLAFSYGVRKCMGFHFANTEMLISLAKLIRKATWTCEETSAKAPWITVPVPKPTDGLLVKLERREKT